MYVIQYHGPTHDSNPRSLCSGPIMALLMCFKSLLGLNSASVPLIKSVWTFFPRTSGTVCAGMTDLTWRGWIVVQKKGNNRRQMADCFSHGFFST